MVLDSSDTIFFPVKTFLRFFLTSLLKMTWKKKMKMPCEVKREKRQSLDSVARVGGRSYRIFLD